MAGEHDPREAAANPTDPRGEALERRQVGLETAGGLVERGLGLAAELAAGGGLVPAAPPRVATIACGWMQALAIGDDGSLWAWGSNLYAQLGLGERSETLTPARVDDSGWSAISAAGEHGLGVKCDGSLWYWGAASESGLNITRRGFHTRPAQLGTGHDWLAVSAGREHSLALQRDGSLWSWGSRNYCGELGHDGWIPPGTITEADEIAALEVMSAAVNLGIHHFCRVGGATEWAAVSAGGEHSLALKRDGSLWACGDNSHGQLGHGDKTRRRRLTRVGGEADWAAVSTFYSHSLALKSDGSLWAWGWNERRQLGFGDQIDRLEPTRVGDEAGWAVIGAGSRHSLALKDDGSLWAWGENDDGQLGLGDEASRRAPTRVGGDCDWVAISAGHDFSLALKGDGGLWSWGSNDWGALGVGDRTVRLAPTRVCALTECGGHSFSTGSQS